MQLDLAGTPWTYRDATDDMLAAGQEAAQAAAAAAAQREADAIKIVQARRAPVVTGTSELVGQVGIVRDALAPAGTVFVRGELWKARSSDGPLERGSPVRVDSIDDELVLEVEPAEQPVPVT